MNLRTSKRKFLIVAAALTISFVVALLIGEIALRLLLPNQLASSSKERALFCRYDRKLGWAPRERITAKHLTDGLSALVHQNQFGLRGSDEMQHRNSGGKRRILVLGDSYAWGFGVNQNELFSAPEVHGPEVEILNFGVSGYGTDQEYLLYLRKGTNFVVDEVVVVLTPYNDVGNNLSPKQYGYLKPYFTLDEKRLVLHDDHIRDVQQQGLTFGLRHHSRVWTLLSEAARAFSNPREKRQNRESTAEAKPIEYRQEDISERDRAGGELTVAILKHFRDAVAARNAEFSVIFVPYKPHIDKRLSTNHPLVPAIAAGLTREGITYREPYPAFLQAALAGSQPFNDPDNHFGPKGHALFARFLTRTEMAAASVNYYARQ